MRNIKEPSTTWPKNLKLLQIYPSPQRDWTVYMIWAPPDAVFFFFNKSMQNSSIFFSMVPMRSKKNNFIPIIQHSSKCTIVHSNLADIFWRNIGEVLHTFPRHKINQIYQHMCVILYWHKCFVFLNDSIGRLSV